MIAHPLNGAIQRVTRAQEHLGDLETRLPNITSQQLEAFVIKFDDKPPYNPKLVMKPSRLGVPMSIGIIIGEICYNLRGALDYFIFELARLDSGKVQPGTQFPIEDDPERYKGRRNSYLKGVSATHIAAIEQLQPYSGCDWSAALRDFSNRDKHREFVAIGGDYAAHVFTPWTDANFSEIQLPIRRSPHPVFGEVDVKLHALITIRFPDQTPIVETLQKIKSGVAQTLRDFEHEF